MDKRGELFSTIKGLFGRGQRENNHEKSGEEEIQQVLEKFRLMGASGSEGQQPVVSYGEGSTIILSDLPKGTILREKRVSDDTPGENLYSFFYVSGLNESKTRLVLYDHKHPRIDPRLSYIVNTPYAGCTKRELPVGKSQKLEYEIGQPGILIDVDFRNRLNPWFNQMYKSRQTTQIDIMEFGQRVKKEVKVKQRQALGQLVPSPESQSI